MNVTDLDTKERDVIKAGHRVMLGVVAIMLITGMTHNLLLFIAGMETLLLCYSFTVQYRIRKKMDDPDNNFYMMRYTDSLDHWRKKSKILAFIIGVCLGFALF